MCRLTCAIRAARQPLLGLATSAVICAWASLTFAQAPATPPEPAAQPAEAAAAADIAPHATLAAQEQTHADTLRSERLNSALRDYARVGAAMRVWGGVSELILAGASTTVGILVATDDASRWGKSRASAALAGTLLTIGGGLIVSAVVHWVRAGSAERRLQRWDALSNQQQRDPAQLAHFEGELQSEAEGGAERRLDRLPTGIGFVAGGGALIGFAASSAFDHGARTTAYTLGACYAGVGVLQIASALLSESLGEKIWHRYSASGDPALTTLRLHPM